MFILKKGHQPGVYVPLRALFLVLHVYMYYKIFRVHQIRCYQPGSHLPFYIGGIVQFVKSVSGQFLDFVHIVSVTMLIGKPSAVDYQLGNILFCGERIFPGLGTDMVFNNGS